MPVQDWVIDEIFRTEKFEVRIPYTTINTNSENSDYINTCVLVLLPSQFCVQTFFKSTLDLLSQLKKNKQHEIQRNIFFVRKRK